MFANVPEDHPAAAFLILNDPVGQAARIREAVEAGYIVRTRADADTREARTGDMTRRDAAFATGAQFVSTDYYRADPRFKTGYEVRFEGGTTLRCNPVRRPTWPAPYRRRALAQRGLRPQRQRKSAREPAHR